MNVWECRVVWEHLLFSIVRYVGGVVRIETPLRMCVSGHVLGLQEAHAVVGL